MRPYSGTGAPLRLRAGPPKALTADRVFRRTRLWREESPSLKCLWIEVRRRGHPDWSPLGSGYNQDETLAPVFFGGCSGLPKPREVRRSENKMMIRDYKEVMAHGASRTIKAKTCRSLNGTWHSPNGTWHSPSGTLACGSARFAFVNPNALCRERSCQFLSLPPTLLGSRRPKPAGKISNESGGLDIHGRRTHRDWNNRVTYKRQPNGNQRDQKVGGTIG
jgi:hypothetical protein